MTRLPKPKRWVLAAMNEMETAEMIEKHIEHYAVDKDGNRYPVHYPTNFVRHYMQRKDDDALPIAVTIGTMPIVLGYGDMLAPAGFDRLRGIQFMIQPELRAILPKREDCTPEAVKAAIKFLLDEWLYRRQDQPHRQVHHHRRRAHHDRAFAAGSAARLSSTPPAGAAAARPLRSRC